MTDPAQRERQFVFPSWQIEAFKRWFNPSEVVEIGDATTKPASELDRAAGETP